MFVARDPYGIKPLYFADDGAHAPRRVAGARRCSPAARLARARSGRRGRILARSAACRSRSRSTASIRAVEAGTSFFVDASGVSRAAAHTTRSPRRSRTRREQERSPRLVEPRRAAARAGHRFAALSPRLRRSGRRVPLRRHRLDRRSSRWRARPARRAAAHDDAALRRVSRPRRRRGAAGRATSRGRSACRTRHARRHARRVPRRAAAASSTPWTSRPSTASTPGSSARPRAERGLKVAMSGLGGDELFGGYPSFRDMPRIVRRLARAAARRAAAGALRARTSEERQHRRATARRGAGAYLRQARPVPAGRAAVAHGRGRAREGLRAARSLDHIAAHDRARSRHAVRPRRGAGGVALHAQPTAARHRLGLAWRTRSKCARRSSTPSLLRQIAPLLLVEKGALQTALRRQPAPPAPRLAQRAAARPASAVPLRNGWNSRPTARRRACAAGRGAVMEQSGRENPAPRHRLLRRLRRHRALQPRADRGAGVASGRATRSWSCRASSAANASRCRRRSRSSPTPRAAARLPARGRARAAREPLRSRRSAAHVNLLPVARLIATSGRCSCIYGIEAWKPLRDPISNRLLRDVRARRLHQRRSPAIASSAGRSTRAGRIVLPNAIRAEDVRHPSEACRRSWRATASTANACC